MNIFQYVNILEIFTIGFIKSKIRFVGKQLDSLRARVVRRNPKGYAVHVDGLIESVMKNKLFICIRFQRLTSFSVKQIYVREAGVFVQTITSTLAQHIVDIDCHLLGVVKKLNTAYFSEK